MGKPTEGAEQREKKAQGYSFPPGRTPFPPPPNPTKLNPTPPPTTPLPPGLNISRGTLQPETSSATGGKIFVSFTHYRDHFAFIIKIATKTKTKTSFLTMHPINCAD
jgi:hypothetical protein